ncbi:MAG: DUF3343 domain-containing protein [Eubacterium sp.]|nr:DUF3343 domain-containing protein [Eubacterium sp.]
MYLYIKVGSITNAQRAKSILNKNRIKASVVRLENPKPGDGCGYVVKVDDRGDKNVIEILKNHSIRILGYERH